MQQKYSSQAAGAIDYTELCAGLAGALEGRYHTSEGRIAKGSETSSHAIRSRARARREQDAGLSGVLNQVLSVLRGHYASSAEVFFSYSRRSDARLSLEDLAAGLRREGTQVDLHDLARLLVPYTPSSKTQLPRGSGAAVPPQLPRATGGSSSSSSSGSGSGRGSGTLSAPFDRA